MYVKICRVPPLENRRCSVSMKTGSADLKEVAFMITKGAGAYSRLKYERWCTSCTASSETESGGRIHTSTCTVAVMPEAEEIDFHLI